MTGKVSYSLAEGARKILTTFDSGEAVAVDDREVDHDCTLPDKGIWSFFRPFICSICNAYWQLELVERVSLRGTPMPPQRIWARKGIFISGAIYLPKKQTIFDEIGNFKDVT